MDPILVGALIWLAQRLAEKGFDRIFDRVVDGPRIAAPAPAPFAAPPPVRRHDLTVAGAQGTSDVDFAVRHHLLAQGRKPIILTFQKFNDTTTGTTFPMVLGDTAHVTLPRDHYFVTALIIDLPGKRGAMPTLRGVGWAQPYVADNHTAKITIGTQHPTEKLVKKLGLKKSDGGEVFHLPPEPPAEAVAMPPIPPTPAQQFEGWPRIKNRYTPPANTPPLFTGIKKFPTAGKFSSNGIKAKCRARAFVGTTQCTFLAMRDRLCSIHRAQVLAGTDIRDYRTGERIVLP
ncbi:hypothetical protein ACFWY9_39155 [Amycolatopsis sp. NPDC059027]|uniref:hypothetical protein n=1 Tax=unclassified Amycolatopsis TaxID=2618356 RepID=UPI00366E66A7